MLETFLAVVQAPECANVVVPPATPEALHYYDTGNILWIITNIWTFIITLLFLFHGFTAKLEKASKAIGRVWFFQIIVYLILFISIYTALSFPIDYYAGYIRPHDYGLSTQSHQKWFENYGKTYLLTVIGASLVVWIFYLLIKKSPKRWWLYSSIVAIALSIFTSLIQPIWIDPLFNQFGPMKNKELESEILALAKKAGIEHSRVYEVEKSNETTALNAYVTGIGSTNRIVLWDTTLDKMTSNQILFVMGHEMGHYVLNHVQWSLLYSSILILLIFYLTYKSGNFLLRKFHHAFGFTDLDAIASLPLLLFLFTFFNFLSSPLTNYLSRTMEREADRFGLEITQNNEAAGEAFLVLQQKNLANPYPGPIYVFWRASHPPLGERVAFCNSYCPWKQDKPLEYGKYFSD